MRKRESQNRPPNENTIRGIPKRMMQVSDSSNPHDAWRVSLPKEMCRILDIKPGDTVKMSIHGSGILVKPAFVSGPDDVGVER